MAKTTGLGQQFYFHGYDLSGDVGALNTISSTRTSLDVTPINSSSVERLYGTTDGMIDFASFFNPAALGQHDALRALPSTDVIAVFAQGGAVGDVAAGLVGKQANFDHTRGADGSLTINTVVNGNSTPLEWGEMLTSGVDVHGSASSSASKDDSASSANGIAAYLHVTDIDSGTPTIIIQESSDNGSGDAWATLVSFTAVANGNEPTAERKTVSGTVERYLRVTTTGTFSNVDFCIAYRRGTAQDKEAY